MLEWDERWLDTKARVWVEPYVQVDGPVRGYWRDLADLNDPTAVSIRDLFTMDEIDAEVGRPYHADDLPAKEQAQTEIRSTLEVIDKIHLLPATDQEPSLGIDRRAIYKAHGRARFGVDGAAIMLRDIGVAYDVNPGVAAYTLAHEMGHAMDFLLGSNGVFASAQPRGQDDHGLKNFEAAIWSTATYKRNQHRHSLTRVVSSGRASRQTRYEWKEFANVFQNDKELFARAYAQWVMTRSGSDALRQGFAETVRRTDEHPTPEDEEWEGVGFFESVWPDDEFEVIAEALEDLLRTRGLLR